MYPADGFSKLSGLLGQPREITAGSMQRYSTYSVTGPGLPYTAIHGLTETNLGPLSCTIIKVPTQSGSPCDRSFSADAVLNKVCLHWDVGSATSAQLHHTKCCFWWVWRLTTRLVCKKICSTMLSDIESYAQSCALGTRLHATLVSDQCPAQHSLGCGASSVLMPSLEVYCYALAAPRSSSYYVCTSAIPLYNSSVDLCQCRYIHHTL